MCIAIFRHSQLDYDLSDDDDDDGDGGWRWTLGAIFQALLYTLFETQLMLHAFAANVVLYIYCKALAEEGDFGSNYVCLPFDNADDKVSEVV